MTAPLSVQAQEAREAQNARDVQDVREARNAREARAFDLFDEDGRREFWAALALRYTQGLGLVSAKKLLDHFGSAYAAVQAASHWGRARLSAEHAAQFASGAWRIEAKKEWELAKKLDASIVLWTATDYPALLRQLPDAPLFLYCRGNLNLLHAPCVALVGSRTCSAEGLAVTRHIASKLAACGITVVSGLALGIDTQAHQAALEQVGSSIAVLGTGLDLVYPPANAPLFASLAQKGLLLTEFMPSTAPHRHNFPIRNRIISGLSLGVLVVEAAQKSGSLITARLALEQNREVYTVPGSFFAESSRGCQALTRQGARCIFSAEDILHDLAPLLQSYKFAPQLAEVDSRSAATALTPRLEAVDSTGADPAPVPALVPDAAALPGRRASRVRSGPRPKVTGSQSARQQGASPASAPPDGDAARVIAFLQDSGPQHIDRLANSLELPVAALSALLVQLEMQAWVRRLPGMRYESTSAAGSGWKL